ncbi:hypothetical protein AB6A40_000738 [Gnathostoma spinigerum]|uniref:Solute carrier family 40 member n=1 Tax=Gnathostoma spinigerum TaxID=75299 RepID=A0ABD6E9J3_9BILA
MPSVTELEKMEEISGGGRLRKLCSSAFNVLYCAYVISATGDRLWMFSIAIFLQELGGMRLVAINQLANSIVQVALSSYVGSWLDSHNRKKGVLTMLFFNNIFIAISAVLLGICLSSDMTNSIYAVCLFLSIITNTIAQVASDGEKIAFTKDWVVVVDKASKETALARRNATMKTIDQLASVIAPLVSGIIIEKNSARTACYLFVVWNLSSWIIERILLVYVYNRVPQLAVRKLPKDLKDEWSSHELLETRSGMQESESTQMNDDRTTTLTMEPRPSDITVARSNRIKIYWKQPAFMAGLGLAFLYMTILGNDGICVGFGKSQGLSEVWLGGFRSLGALFGIIGAIVFPLMTNRIGLRKSGFVGLTWQHFSLYLCLASIWLPGSPFDPRGYAKHTGLKAWWQQLEDAISMSSAVSNPFDSRNLTETVVNGTANWDEWSANEHSTISIAALFAGIVLARFGLWIADLSITQIQQETIEEHERNTVFGVQFAANRFFFLLKDILVILLPDPKTFGILIIASFAFVTFGFICYLIYLLKFKRSQRISRVGVREFRSTTKQNGSFEPLQT